MQVPMPVSRRVTMPSHFPMSHAAILSRRHPLQILPPQFRGSCQCVGFSYKSLSVKSAVVAVELLFQGESSMAVAPAHLSVQEKRKFMAAVLAETQREMSVAVDLLGIATRSAVPYPSTWTGKAISMTGPIPQDLHLVPSGTTIMMSAPPDFKAMDGGHEILGLSGKPYAGYTKPHESIFLAKLPPVPPVKKVRQRTDEEVELWKAQFNEWTLQKNSYNPDIAAATRTNVRKAASLMAPPLDKPSDPARTSENVRAALSDSSVTGMCPPKAKEKIGPSTYFPSSMQGFD